MRIILGSSPSLRHLCLATRRESVLRGDGRRAEYHHHISSCQNLDSRPRGSFELLLQAPFCHFSDRHAVLDLACGSAQRLRILTRFDMRL